MPKIVDADAQRAHIRSAARRVFAERGMSGTGLAHVARAANVSRPTLYHYYEDKDALVADIAAELLDEESLLFAKCLTGEGPIADRIELLSQTIIERFSAWSSEGGTLLEVWVDQRTLVGTAIAEMRKNLAALISQGQRQGELDLDIDSLTTATMLMALIDGLILQAYLAPKGLPPRKSLQMGLSRNLRAILKVDS